MNPNRSTGPSSEPVEVHTRTRHVTLNRFEAHAALAQAAMEKAGINPELNDARATVNVYEGPDDGYGSGGEMIFNVTITEDLSGPAIPDEAPTDPSAFRLFGQPRSIIMANIVAECQPIKASPRRLTEPTSFEVTPYWDGVVPRYPNNT